MQVKGQSVSEQVVRIGLVGFGTVGDGVAKLLLEQGDAIASRTSLRLELAKVVDLDTTSPRPVALPAGMLTSDFGTILNDKSIQIAIELVGGTGAAKDIQLKLLAAGKDVVTANKALLAEHGAEIFAAARKLGRCVAFEASCAGGIPLISAMRVNSSTSRREGIMPMLGPKGPSCGMRTWPPGEPTPMV